MSHSPSSNQSRSTHSQGDYEMYRFHSTPSGQENLVTYTDQTTTKGNKSNRLSPVLNWRLVFGLLWILPMIFLLWLNFSSHVIGGTAWCFKKPCGVIQYDSESEVTTNALIDRYEKANHNLLGTLQFAAKALEVWFMYIASSLVYLVAYTLAQRPGGLPTGHILTHLEYADLLWLLGLIRSLLGLIRSRTLRVESGRAVLSNRMPKTYLYLFTLLTVLMCIIANLIGPSIAVLMLPTLRWQDTKHFNEAYFVRLGADSPPAGDLTPGCTADDLRKPDYTCFKNHYRNDIDALIIGNAVIIDKTINESTKSPNTVVTYEGILPFVYNITYPPLKSNDTSTIWALSRQVLRSLSKDFEELYNISQGMDPTNSRYPKRFKDYRSSRSLKLQRQGPIIGIQAGLGYGNLTTTTIDSDREGLCYHWEDDLATMTCFGALQGWNKANRNYTIASFTIMADESTDLLPIKMRTYWSDRIGQFPSNPSEPCLRNGTATKDNRCDYDILLSDEVFEGQLVMELSQPTSPHPESVWVMMFSLSYGFATYTFDATTISPNLQNVVVPDPPQLDKNYTMVFNPAWVLAAWGVNSDGNLSSSRDAVLKFQQSAQAVFDSTDNDSDGENFVGAFVYTMAQAASLVTFTNSTIGSPWSQELQTDNGPVLWTNMRREIWGWKIESRTSRLGVGVAIAGILTALVRTGLLIITREKKWENTEIIAAALQHRYNGEFGRAVKESELARVRYRIGQDEETGKLRFVPA